jgi:hypothetical protein
VRIAIAHSRMPRKPEGETIRLKFESQLLASAWTGRVQTLGEVVCFRWQGSGSNHRRRSRAWPFPGYVTSLCL